MAWVTEWWKTTKTASSVWRLTRLYTVLLLLIVSVLLIVLYQLSIGQMSRQQSLQMDNEIVQQTELSKQLPHDEFIEQFKIQSENSRQYILSYQYQSQVIGRLNTFPQNISACPTRTRFPVWSNQYNELRLVSGCIQPLHEGRLIIAIDDEYLYVLKDQFISASLIALALALLFGVITGVIFSKQVLKRINSFNTTAALVESGQLSARVEVSKNNDEYDHMALHINTMLSQLEESFNTTAGITDAIAHDLRTPLSHLRQQIEAEFTENFKQNLPTESLQLMLEKLNEILFTFAAMLELTRIQQQKEKKSQHFKRVDLNTIIIDAVDLIEPLVEERQQIVRMENSMSLFVNGDASLLFRVLYNLLENASKYAGNNAEIIVRMIKNGFMVIDNGIGISDDEKDKVFQRLYRVEKSRQVTGFGLGLTLVKAVVQLHEGNVTLLDNDPGLIVKVEFFQTA
ncbi:HAMP domain-containing histidine kinase [Psychromonas sp.]|nr:HAMP domain-containing histidine kinase [Psychromonas sp.]